MSREIKGSVSKYRGQWRAYVGREYLGLHPTEQAARRVIKAWLRDTEDKAPDIFDLFGESWLDERELSGRVRSVHRERSAWATHVKPWRCYTMSMRRIRPIDVQQLIGKLLKTKSRRRGSDRTLARETVVKVRTLLWLCFEQARIEGKISANPVEGVFVPRVDRVREDSESWAWLTLAEIDALFAELAGNARLTAAYAIAIYCGLRKGEIIGLRWQDVGADEIRVRRSYASATKTAGSRRDVPLVPPVVEALRAWRKASRVVQISGLVFPSASGGCLGPSYHFGWLDHEGRPGLRTRAKIRDHVRFHDLRHTCASHLTQGSWSQWFERKPSREEVRDWLGHSALSVTERYSHLDPEGIRGLIRKNPNDSAESRDSKKST